ncbi:hypothetical protein [Flavobacterium sp. U410]
MKLVEFVKKNISVFSALGIILVLIFFKIYFFYEKKGTQQDIILVYNLLLIPLSLFIFIIDLLSKIVIKNRIIINIIQMLIVLLALVCFKKYI